MDVSDDHRAGLGARARAPRRRLRVALVAVGSLFVLLAALVLIRAPRPDGNRSNAKWDAELGWAPDCKPEQPACDLDRTVGQRLELPDPGKQHIVMLGDSVTYGHGVGDAETFSAGLGRRIKDGRYQVLNAAVTGWSIDQYYLYLERILPKVHPRLVVVNIFTGNDYQGTVHDNNYGYKKPLYRIQDGRLVLTEPRLSSFNCPHFLSNSVAFSLMWRWASVRDRSVGGRREAVLDLLKTLCGSRDLSAVEGPVVIRKLIDAIDELTKRAGAELVYVLLPRLSDGTSWKAPEGEWVAPWPTLPFFQNLFEGTAYDVLDFSKTIISRFCPRGTDDCDWRGMEDLFLDGGHYTVKGHDLLAETLYQHLRARYGIE
jgi:lysophospholipase L1-like esterase